MARRYYRYYRRRYPYRSYRRAYSSYSRSKRRAYGNYKAALQQKDSTQVNLSIPGEITCFNKTTTGIRVGPSVEDVISISNGVAAINIWDVLRKSEFFDSYASMYDQVKIDRIQVKLTPYSFPVLYNNNSDTYRTYTICTAWDRSGLSSSQLQLVDYYTENSDTGYIGEFDENGDPVSNDYNGLYVKITGSELGTYSSAINKNITQNSNTSIVRRLYPSTNQEKGQYVSTDNLIAWYKDIDKNLMRYYGLKNPQAIGSYKYHDFDNKITIEGEDEDSDVVNMKIPLAPFKLNDNELLNNPCFIMESPSIPFKPTLLVGLQNNSYTIDVGGASRTVNPEMLLNAEFDIVCTFRGLRKTKIINA